MLHLAAKKEEGTGRKRIDDTLIGASSLGAKPTLTSGRRGFYGRGDIDRGWKEEEGRGTSREERHSAPMSVAAGGWVGG